MVGSGEAIREKGADMSKRAAIYARVSTDDQADRGYSLPVQLEACRAYVERLGYTVTEEIREDYSGATPITERPQGAVLADLVKRRAVDAVIVYRVDRLSRDLIDLLVTVRAWLGAGIELHAGDIGKVEHENDIILVLRGWQGGDERKKIIERTNGGRWRKAREGKAVGAGTPPYGYTYQDGELTIKEPEAGVVRLIYRLYTEGDENGKHLGAWEIARHLAGAGIPTPSESKGLKVRRKRGPCQWDATSVYNILKADTYCGVLRYGKNIGNRGRGGKRPEAEHITREIPAIVSRETWQAAQEQREHNRITERHKTRFTYTLRGMVRCGCGFAFVATNKRYRCSKYTYRGGPCGEPSVSAPLLDGLVYEYMMGLIHDSTTFEESLRRAQAEEIKALEPKRDELDSINTLIEQAEEEAEQTVQVLKAARGIVLQKAQRDVDEINARYDTLCQRRENLLSDLRERTLTDETITDLLTFRETVEAGLTDPTPEDLQQWYRILRVQVLIKERKAIITCRLTTEPSSTHLTTSRNLRNLQCAFSLWKMLALGYKTRWQREPRRAEQSACLLFS